MTDPGGSERYEAALQILMEEGKRRKRRARIA
jgi:hypothetical protein